MDESQLNEHQEELAKLKAIADQHLDGWKRAKADYLNLKKQTEKEKEELVQFAQAGAVLQFLPVYDNLKRAASHIPNDQQSVDWVKGILHIIKQFDDTLKTMGITPIKTVGETFDPNRHHAVHKVKQEGVKSDVIVEETKSGFLIGDKVLEPAQVVVAE